MKKVLIISYRYPPYMSAGAIRISKFARYLPEFGWMPIVLTASSDLPPVLTLESSAPVYRTRRIDPLLALARLFRGRGAVQSPASSSIRGWCLKIVSAVYRRVVIPDPEIGWYPFALAAGRRIVSRERPDMIFSSALPATSHLIASTLARETGVPWVAEFRDPWTDHHLFRRPEPLLSVERLLERRVMRRAASIVTVSRLWADLLVRSLDKPVVVITNGFDPADYPDHVTPSPHFKLTYTGTYYSRNYDSESLLKAIAQLAREGLITPDSFELQFVGSGWNRPQKTTQELGIERFVSFLDVVPHEESVRAQVESTALVFFSWVGPRGEGTFTSKIYEYLGSGRPILAIGPETVAMQLVEACQAGVVARTSTEIAAVLRRWLQEFRESGTVHIPRDAGALRAFERRVLTGQLAEVLNQAHAGG